jgi:hypothetical protein
MSSFQKPNYLKKMLKRGIKASASTVIDSSKILLVLSLGGAVLGGQN